MCKKEVFKIADLTFKEDTHSYFLGTVPIPSVSEIISPIYQRIYGKIDKETLEIAADRGTRVHRSIEFLSKYNLCAIDNDISGYIGAYKRFQKEHKSWILKHSELRTYHKFLLYGMTIDQVLKTKEGVILCDIKTTKIAHPKAWSIQLSAYKAGYESQHEKVAKIIALQLFEDTGEESLEYIDNSSVITIETLSTEEQRNLLEKYGAEKIAQTLGKFNLQSLNELQKEDLEEFERELNGAPAKRSFEGEKEQPRSENIFAKSKLEAEGGVTL